MTRSVLAVLAAAAPAAVLALAAGAASAAPSAGSTTMSPVDYALVGSTYLGNKFQVDTGKLGETHAAAPAVKTYAALMDTSHVQVEDKLVALLKKRGLTQPTLTLIQGAYATIVRTLSTAQGAAFDHAYIRSQLDYQNANDALYRWEIANGADPELKTFAKAVLVKIDDHKSQVEKLSAAQK